MITLNITEKKPHVLKFLKFVESKAPLPTEPKQKILKQSTV